MTGSNRPAMTRGKIMPEKDEDKAGTKPGGMVGESPAMRNLYDEIRKIAPVATTVLIQGESGTGKELVARALHENGPRRDRPFLVFNCSAIPDTLFESQMFGHQRGAFTGAVTRQSGFVEEAEGGTLFLDEISELSQGAQAKILRLMEQRTYQPLGHAQEKHADVRLLAATNRALEPFIDEGRFREDLYYRLNACRIEVPPLRERRDDIPLLARYFVRRAAAEMGKRLTGIEEDALRQLKRYRFPGNVRELRNMVECAVIHCEHDGSLRNDDFLETCRSRRTESCSESAAKSGNGQWPLDTFDLQEVETRLYRAALQRCEGNISAAARLVGVDRSKLRRRLKKLEIA